MQCNQAILSLCQTGTHTSHGNAAAQPAAPRAVQHATNKNGNSNQPTGWHMSGTALQTRMQAVLPDAHWAALVGEPLPAHTGGKSDRAALHMTVQQHRHHQHWPPTCDKNCHRPAAGSCSGTTHHNARLHAMLACVDSANLSATPMGTTKRCFSSQQCCRRCTACQLDSSGSHALQALCS